MIGILLGLNIVVVAVYAVAEHGSAAVRYIPEVLAMLAFASLAGWSPASRKWRSVSASMGLLTGSAALVDISGGLTELHFSFFVVIVVLTLYEDWVPFLVAVAFVLIHHGVMGTIDPSAVFDTRAAQEHPWAYAGLHALFVALAGVAGVTAWGLNERVRDRMRDVQRQLEHLGLTDALTGLGNRRQLMGDVQRLLDDGRPAALAIFDLDGFKEYNDRFGHPAGDALLVRLDVGVGGVRGRDRERLPPRWRRVLRPGRRGGQQRAGSAAGGVDRLLQRAGRGLHHHGLQRRGADPGGGRPTPPRRCGSATGACTPASTAAAPPPPPRRATCCWRRSPSCQDDLDEHVGGVAGAAERVGEELGLTGVWLQELGHAADLHDIGKVAVPASILSKPGPLTAEEWEFVERHPVIGERILAAAPALARLRPHRPLHP